MKPAPVQDLARFLRESGRPFTDANVRAVAKMLSLTPGELVLALTLAQEQEAAA